MLTSIVGDLNVRNRICLQTIHNTHLVLSILINSGSNSSIDKHYESDPNTYIIEPERERRSKVEHSCRSFRNRPSIPG